MNLLRGALAKVLAGEAGFQVVAELGTYSDLPTAIAGLGPDVALLGLNPPTAEGLAAAAWLAEHVPQCAILLVTGVGGIDRIRKALNSGALDGAVRGIVGTDSTLTQLTQYIRQAAAGERVVDPQLALLPGGGRNPLTTREGEVLRLAATGKPDREIAAILGLSTGTVRNYLSGILAKTGARNRVEAVRMAERAGWI
jgi:two-component system response regulator DesR